MSAQDKMSNGTWDQFKEGFDSGSAGAERTFLGLEHIHKYEYMRCWHTSQLLICMYRVRKKRLLHSLKINESGQSIKNGKTESAAFFFSLLSSSENLPLWCEIDIDLLIRLTNHKSHELRLAMTDVNGNTRTATYGTFRLLGESDDYRLEVGGFAPDHGWIVADHLENGTRFNTHDRDGRPGTCDSVDFVAAGW